MPAFENACSELSKSELIEELGKTLDEKYRLTSALKQLWNILGPSTPASLPCGPDSEWSAALKLLREVLDE